MAAGPVLAGESDAFLSRLADSPLLTPRFSHLEPATLAGLTERDVQSPLVPLFQAEQRSDPRRPLTTQALAIEWQHSLNASQRFSLGAQYSDQTTVERTTLTATGSGATLGLSQQLGDGSLLTGQLFLGDEDTKARLNNGYGTRRYYGMVFEGRTALWRDHTPFASLSWQRNDYEGLDAAIVARSESVSRFAAGWNWQVSPDLDLRAEAQYRLTEDVLDPAEQDRLQFYFRSRYGFR
jgi:hypothetical protein